MNRFILKYKKNLIFTMLAIIASSIVNITLAFLLEKIIDVVQIGDFYKFYNIVIIIIIFILSDAAANYLRNYSQSVYIKKTMYYIKDEIFEKILNKSTFDFYSNNSAKYISLICNDIKMIEDNYINNIFFIFENVILLIGSIISLFILNYELTIILICMCFFTFLIPKFFENKLANRKAMYSSSLEKFTIWIKDIFSGFEVIKTFNIEKKISNQYSKLNLNVENSKCNFEKLNIFANSISMLSGLIMFMGIVIIGTYLCINGRTTLGVLMACIQLTNNVTNPIFNSITYINKVKSMKSIENKVLDIYKENIENDEEYIRKDNFNNEIILNDLKFYYEKDNYILNGIDLKIEKGKKYVLVGMSGCGKSTLIKILSKQLLDYSGKIKFDDIDLKNIKSEDLYSLISVIHQNVFLFDDTIRNNITLFKNYEENHIKKCMENSGLGHFYEKLDDHVGENGNLLSGGEKQRIAIARALVLNTPILMLDEATASLDNTTSYDIENTILNLDNHTLLVITHKLDEKILKQYDEIIVLKRGIIIEKGNFEELINNKKYFYSLYNMQK